MRSRCSATLTVTCKQPDVKLSINNKPLVCGEKQSFKPGTYQIEAVQGKRKHSFSKNLDEGARHYDHTFVMPKETVGKTIVIRQDGFAYTRTTIAAASTIVIAGLLTTFWHLEGENAAADLEEYNKSRTKSTADSAKKDVLEHDANTILFGWSAIGVGITGAAATAIFYFVDRSSAEESKRATPSTPKVSVMPTHDGFQAGVQFNF